MLLPLLHESSQPLKHELCEQHVQVLVSLRHQLPDHHQHVCESDILFPSQNELVDGLLSTQKTREEEQSQLHPEGRQGDQGVED